MSGPRLGQQAGSARGFVGRDREEFILDQSGQRLWFKAPEGRPSAAPSVEILDSGGAELSADATTNVTQDPVNTTLAATPSVGDKELQLTAVTNLRLRAEYRLTNTDTGQYEDVRILSTANNVLIDSPLKYAYSATAVNNTFVSREYYYTLQAADYDTLRELVQANATYAVGGLNYRHRKVFDIVKTPLENPLAAALMYARWPDLARQEHDEQRGEDYKPQREDAWSQVKRAIRQQSTLTDSRYGKREKWRPAMVMDVSDLFEWGMAQLKLNLHLSGVTVDRDSPTREMLAAALEHERTLALATISWLDKDEDQAIDEGEEVPLEVDFVR
jgi:hypothetical protein